MGRPSFQQLLRAVPRRLRRHGIRAQSGRDPSRSETRQLSCLVRFGEDACCRLGNRQGGWQEPDRTHSPTDQTRPKSLIPNSRRPAHPRPSGEKTQPGTTIGTPIVHEPRAGPAAHLRRSGRPATFYSLGATLYELLTGTSPLSGGSRPSRSSPRSRRASSPSPRVFISHDPSGTRGNMPEGHGTQAGKTDTNRRGKLALDLEHWVADEPVAAYPERPVQKAVAMAPPASLMDPRPRQWPLVGITMVATIAGVRG